MNTPKVHELFTLPDGVDKVHLEEDSNFPFVETFKFYRDPNLGNKMCVQMLQAKRVLVAGYKPPHPLDKKIEVKVQTDGTITPHQAKMDNLELLSENMKSLEISTEENHKA